MHGDGRGDDSGGFSIVAPAVAAVQGAAILSSTALQIPGRLLRMDLGSVDGGGHGRGPSVFVKLLLVPVFAYYVGLVVAMNTAVQVVDSEGLPHSVRLGMTPNFTACWKCLLQIDVALLCPLHFWLTLYDAARTPGGGHHQKADPHVSGWSPSHRQVQAIARERVDAAAAAVATLTRWEAIHFTMMTGPPFGSFVCNGFRQGSYFVPFVGMLLIGLMYVGQLKVRVFTRPRVAILRFRGPATAEFASWAVQLHLKVLVLAVLWSAYVAAYWYQQPILVPMDHPTQAQFKHPSLLGSFFFRISGLAQSAWDVSPVTPKTRGWPPYGTAARLCFTIPTLSVARVMPRSLVSGRHRGWACGKLVQTC